MYIPNIWFGSLIHDDFLYAELEFVEFDVMVVVDLSQFEACRIFSFFLKRRKRRGNLSHSFHQGKETAVSALDTMTR